MEEDEAAHVDHERRCRSRAADCEREEEKMFGRGSRMRKEVDYSDSLTEKQGAAIEDGSLDESRTMVRHKKHDPQEERAQRLGPPRVPRLLRGRGRGDKDDDGKRQRRGDDHLLRKLSPNPPALSKE
ncbi:unnamed protein product [Pleuronectes platessa]|uniref:Snf2 ATP coupling domain-containing protein n=1 Tax=Pleuronectes platessa TaxID=8262 RepID=A0A9N7UQZ4_PLEPL|nr:unnamed protein product [Pleuronectes platessa]